jgi:hypothetical protein
VKRILVVVLVPDDMNDWLRHSEPDLVMRRCGYWLSLRGMPATDNAEGKTVHLLRAQLFTVQSLQGMMDRIGQGGLP